MRTLGQTVAVAAVLGAASTAGDWIWARWIPDGAVVPGVVHGILLFCLFAVAIGTVRGGRATGRLLATLPAAGLLIAAGFYPAARLLGYLGALLAAWAAMWLAVAALDRWARGGDEPAAGALARGVAAALLSGLAFWAVSGMWTAPPPGPPYGLRFLYWTAAFWPGIAALLLPLGRREPGRPASTERPG